MEGSEEEKSRHLVRNINKEKRRVVDREKAKYLNKEIGEASGKKSLFKIVDIAMLLCLNWWNGSAATSLPRSPTSVPGCTVPVAVILLMILFWAYLFSLLL